MIYAATTIGWLLLALVGYRYCRICARYVHLYELAEAQNEALHTANEALKDAERGLDHAAGLIRMLVDLRAPLTDDPLQSRLSGVQSLVTSKRTDH